MALTETYFVRKNKKTGHYVCEVDGSIVKYRSLKAAQEDRSKYSMRGRFDTIVQVEVLEYECLE
jgi:hypothetical protein